MATAFIQSINSVSPGEQPDSFRIELNVVFINNDGFVNGTTMAYEAPWGSDWKLLAKESVFNVTAPGNGQGLETVTRVVFSDFSYS